MQMEKNLSPRSIFWLLLCQRNSPVCIYVKEKERERERGKGWRCRKRWGIFQKCNWEHLFLTCDLLLLCEDFSCQGNFYDFSCTRGKWAMGWKQDEPLPQVSKISGSSCAAHSCPCLHPGGLSDKSSICMGFHQSSKSGVEKDTHQCSSSQRYNQILIHYKPLNFTMHFNFSRNL